LGTFAPQIQNKMKKIIFVCSLLLLTVFTQTAFSQTTSIKVGHINSLELLSLMPEVKTADEKIQAEAKALETQFNTMMKEYQAKRSEIESQFEQMDELIKETKIKELQDTEQRIGKFELDAQEKVAKKREELYKPITAKANDAIKAVADANSYVYIFDTRQLLLQRLQHPKKQTNKLFNLNNCI